MKRYFLKTFFLTLFAVLSVHTVIAEDVFENVKSRGVLRVAVMDTGTPPFMTKNAKDEFEGFEYDLIVHIAKKAGSEIEFITCETADELIEQVAKGKADMAISQLSCTPERADKVLFSTPYARLHYGILIKRTFLSENMGSGENVEDFIREYAGTIHTPSKSAHPHVAHVLLPNAKIETIDGFRKLDEAIRSQSVQVFFDDHLTIRDICRRNPDSSIYYKRIILTDTEDPIAIAVHPRNYHAIEWMNTLLEANEPVIKQRIEHPEQKPMKYQ